MFTSEPDILRVMIALYLFVLGAVMGSFVAAMATRLHAGETKSGRSRCDACRHTLAPMDLVPVLSWLWLRGKCRYCKHPIGSSLLAVEVVTGVAFAVSYYAWPLQLVTPLEWSMFVLWLVSLAALAFLFLYDLRHFMLPDVVTKPLMAVGAIFFVVTSAQQGLTFQQILPEGVLALLPVAGVYAALYYVSSGKWVGFGDVKLGVFIGLLLGWQGALMVLVLSNLLGTLYVLPGLLTGKLKRTAHVPFGPFLIAATYLVFLWGQNIIAWYTAFLQV